MKNVPNPTNGGNGKSDADVIADNTAAMQQVERLAPAMLRLGEVLVDAAEAGAVFDSESWSKLGQSIEDGIRAAADAVHMNDPVTAEREICACLVDLLAKLNEVMAMPVGEVANG